MTITSKRRAELRAVANKLIPVAHIGQHGITSALLDSIDDAMRTRELVKIQLGKQVDTPPKELAGELATLLEADIVQVIGKVVCLYRPKPVEPPTPTPKKKGRVPRQH